VLLGSKNSKEDCGEGQVLHRGGGMRRTRGRPYDTPQYRRNRKALLRGKPLCALRIRCGNPPAPATTADHIVPLEQGGTNEMGNLQPACKSCNASKQNKTRLSSGSGR